jgi:anti-sigma B factor antagonist
MTELATVILEERDGIFVARVRGEIDTSNADGLTGTISRAVSNVVVGMILDLSEVSYLDSSGIRLVFELARLLRQRGQRICLVIGGHSLIQRVLQLTDVPAVMSVCGSVEEARERMMKPDRKRSP